MDRSVLEQSVEAGVRVGPQHAFELGQVVLRMDVLAVERVGEPYGWRHGIAGEPVIAHISPQARCFGLAFAGREHRNRRVVGVQLRDRQHMAPDRIDQ